MSNRQLEALIALGAGAKTTTGVAMLLDCSAACASKTLTSLYRRSLVSITDNGTWYATERGKAKVAA